MFRLLVPSLLLLLAPVSFAADPLDADDDLLGGETPDDDSTEERLEEDDDLDLLDEEEDDDFEFDTDEEDDLLGEEDGVEGGEAEQAEGSDTAALFRAQQLVAEELPADEAVQSWEAYLETYPNSVFRERINEIIDNLMTSIYDGSVGNQQGVKDAQQELKFAHPIFLENLNPRTRLQAGFEWGLPDYMNIFADYEHALLRNFSIHAAMRNRYTGWNFETGGRLALHKSLRTQSIVTVIGDLHFNTNPAFLGIRPQIAYGQRFGKLDLQVQGGVDLELRKFAGLRVIGGANATYRLADTVAAFLETNFNMKNLGWDNGPFRFNVITFGMKFFPAQPKGKEDNLEVNMSSSVPYTSNYWMYHYGSIAAQMNYFMD